MVLEVREIKEKKLYLIHREFIKNKKKYYNLCKKMIKIALKENEKQRKNGKLESEIKIRCKENSCTILKDKNKGFVIGFKEVK